MARIEHDFIGDLEVPANAYYGVQSPEFYSCFWA